mmetsp:Transcript_12433/g.41359  ORF Transcript_12433/g.41359 Transcript_12433/m.41359 type:complete len:273 (+) Transcript_12433:457-1275(+)
MLVPSPRAVVGRLAPSTLSFSMDCATGLLTMPCALCAYCSVDRVSSADMALGDTVAMTQVLHRPPRLSWSSLVSLLSRYGILSPFALPPFFKSVITRPRVSKLWLMFFRSRSRFASKSNPKPVNPALFAHSDPARSTMCSFPAHSKRDPSVSSCWLVTHMVNTQCDREDCLFIFVSPTWRFTEARRISARTSSGDVTTSSVRPITKTPFPFFFPGPPGSSTSRSPLMQEESLDGLLVSFPERLPRASSSAEVSRDFMFSADSSANKSQSSSL